MKTIKTDSIKIGESIISGENDRLYMLKSAAEINTIKSNHIDSIYGPFLERNNNIFKLKTNFKVSFSDVFQIEKVEVSNISNSIEFGKTELTLQNAYTYLNTWFSFETEVEKYFYYAFIKYDDTGVYDVVPLMNSFIVVDLGETPVADEAVVQVLLNIKNIEQSVKSIQFIKIDLQAEDIFDTVHIFETNITNDITKVINIMSQETTASNFKFKDDNSVVIYDLYKSDTIPKNSRKYDIENTETVIPKNTEFKDLLMPVYELKYTNPISHTHPLLYTITGAQIIAALNVTEINVVKDITYSIIKRVSTFFDFNFQYGQEVVKQSHIRNYNISIKKEDLKDVHGVPVTNQLDNTVLSATPKTFITQLIETNVYDNIERTIDIPKYGVENNLSTKSRDSNKKELLYEFPVYFPTDEFFYTNSETQDIQYSFKGKAPVKIDNNSSSDDVLKAFETTIATDKTERLDLYGSGSCINTVTLYRLLKPKVVIFNFKSFDDSISSVLLSSKLTIEPRPTFIDIEAQITGILKNIKVKFEKTTYTSTIITSNTQFTNFLSKKTQTDANFVDMIVDEYILYKSINTTLKPVKYLFSDVNPMFSGLDHKGITGGLCITSDGINVDKPEDKIFKYIES